MNLKENCKDLEAKYRHLVRSLGLLQDGDLEDGGTEHNQMYMDLDQVNLLNKIMQLEKDLISKEKEGKLLQMRLRSESSPNRLRQIKSANRLHNMSVISAENGNNEGHIMGREELLNKKKQI